MDVIISRIRGVVLPVESGVPIAAVTVQTAAGDRLRRKRHQG
jgi:hypothetical protein